MIRFLATLCLAATIFVVAVITLVWGQAGQIIRSGNLSPVVTGGGGGTATLTSPGAHCALSGGNLTIANTGTTGNYCGARSTTSHSSGKYYFETQAVAYSAAGDNAVGLANSSASLTNYGGVDTNSIVVYAISTATTWFYNNANVTLHAAPNAAVGDSIGIAFDVGNGTMWGMLFHAGACANSGLWYGNGSAPSSLFNPATNSGGQIIGVTGALYAYAQSYDASAAAANKWTMNFGATSYLITTDTGCPGVPSGFGNI